MKRLLILGAGQYGLVAKEIAEAMGAFSTIEFIDDNNPNAVGKISDIDNIKYDASVVAIGDINVRKKLFNRIKNHVTLIHPNATVMPSAKIGKGVIIEAGAVVCSNANIGDGCIVMSNTVVGHDASVGDFCLLKYGSVVSDLSCLPEQTRLECGTIFKGNGICKR